MGPLPDGTSSQALLYPPGVPLGAMRHRLDAEDLDVGPVTFLEVVSHHCLVQTVEGDGVQPADGLVHPLLHTRTGDDQATVHDAAPVLRVSFFEKVGVVGEHLARVHVGSVREPELLKGNLVVGILPVLAVAEVFVCQPAETVCGLHAHDDEEVGAVGELSLEQLLDGGSKGANCHIREVSSNFQLHYCLQEVRRGFPVYFPGWKDSLF